MSPRYRDNSRLLSPRNLQLPSPRGVQPMPLTTTINFTSKPQGVLRPTPIESHSPADPNRAYEQVFEAQPSPLPSNVANGLTVLGVAQGERGRTYPHRGCPFESKKERKKSAARPSAPGEKK